MKDVAGAMIRAMDGAWYRHEVLAGNIANSETPGYKRQDLDFQGVLQDALGRGMSLARSDSRHLLGRDSGSFRLIRDTKSVSPDGNGVDMDLEMGQIAANALYYEAVSRQMSAYLSLMKRAITEGRR